MPRGGWACLSLHELSQAQCDGICPADRGTLSEESGLGLVGDRDAVRCWGLASHYLNTLNGVLAAVGLLQEGLSPLPPHSGHSSPYRGVFCLMYLRQDSSKALMCPGLTREALDEAQRGAGPPGMVPVVHRGGCTQPPSGIWQSHRPSSPGNRHHTHEAQE